VYNLGSVFYVKTIKQSESNRNKEIQILPLIILSESLANERIIYLAMESIFRNKKQELHNGQQQTQTIYSTKY
jgi:hypothetical protein